MSRRLWWKRRPMLPGPPPMPNRWTCCLLYTSGNINWVAGIAVACGSIPGAALGAKLIPKVPERQLRFLFAGFLVVAAVLLDVYKRQAQVSSDMPTPSSLTTMTTSSPSASAFTVMVSFPSEGIACLMAFSTSGCTRNGGTIMSSSAGPVSTSKARRASPNRASSKLK